MLPAVRYTQNVSELRSFFRIINYYSCFLPNLSTKLAPLYQLLQKDTKWTWGRKQNEAFKAAKSALQDDSLLVHYDESKPLVLACDASQYGLGAVLSHVMEDRKERPVTYASQTLTPAEKNYSQIEKEGLAIIFGVKKFHNRIRPSTPVLPVQRKQRNVSDSIIPDPEMGTYLGCLSLQHPAQTRGYTEQR